MTAPHGGSAPLAGRTALVTGAARGIGRATATALARMGAAVAVNDLDAGPLENLRAELLRSGATAVPVPGSITDDGDRRRIVERVRDAAGDVDVLVHCAGAINSGRSILRMEPDELPALNALHLYGPAMLTQLVLPGMRERRRGSVVMVSSLAASSRPRGSAPYTTSKAAMEAFAYCLAEEERRNGIRVNIVAPGFVDTRLGTEVRDRLARGGTAGPGPVLLPPGAVADVIAFLVSPSARGVTGQRIVVDHAGPHAAATGGEEATP